VGTVRLYLAPEEAAFLAASFPQFVKNNGTSIPVTGLAFDAAATENAFWKFEPINYGSGNVTCDVIWYADTATSGVVRWEAALAAITPGVDNQDVETKAMAAATAVNTTHLGGVGQRLHKTSITITNLDNVAAGDECWLRVTRLGDHAQDTMVGDAIVTSVRLSYSDA